MTRLYQFILILIISVFFAGCDGTRPVKDTAPEQETIKPIDSTILSTMTYEEKVHYAEKLLQYGHSKAELEKNVLLSNALLIVTDIIVTSEAIEEQKAYAIDMARKIMAELNPDSLDEEQKVQQQLTRSSIYLNSFQADRVLNLLDESFYSSQAGQWATYHQLRAISLFQLGHKQSAIKELIIRHAYLITEQQVLGNQNLIWNYLSAMTAYEIVPQEIAEPTRGDRLYTGWLELTRIIRDSRDPQTLNHAISFWLQSYPDHQADRVFINRILLARQEAILSINHVAVLLPQKGNLAKPAQAIRDGILASHYNSPLSSSLKLRFYDTSDKPAWMTYQQAIDNGAQFVIGPLAKSNVESLQESTELGVPTLALNSLEETLMHKAHERTLRLFQFGLSPESEARNAAEKARQDGHYYAAVMAPDNSWGKRMKKAFSDHWQELGGVVVDAVDYDASSHDFSSSIKSMLNIDQSEVRKRLVSQTIGKKVEFTPRRRQDIDMLFMASFPRQARQIPLQIVYHHGETIPVYATSHIVATYSNAKQNIDMDGVRFSDMPFLLGIAPESTSIDNSYENTLYQRLFAMGVDSYRIAPYVNYLYENISESFSGDTGQLSINRAGHVIRSLPWATFKQGNVKTELGITGQESASLY